MPKEREAFENLRRERDGRLERAFSSEHLLAFPEVRIIEGATVFGGALGGGVLRRVRPGPTMLERMAGLYAAGDEQVRKFAADWGPLYICEHGFPQPHHHELGCQPPVWDRPEVWDSGEHADSLTSWRETSNVIRIILTASASLHRGRVYAIKDPEAALIHEWFRGDLRGEDDIAQQRRELANIVWALQYHARVHLRPVWTEERVDIRLGGFGLYAALAAQVLMVLAMKDGFAICSNCPTPYLPSRRPRADEDNYCPSCGRAAAVMAAKRRYRRRIAEQRGSELVRAEDQQGGHASITTRGAASRAGRPASSARGPR